MINSIAPVCAMRRPFQNSAVLAKPPLAHQSPSSILGEAEGRVERSAAMLT